MSQVLPMCGSVSELMPPMWMVAANVLITFGCGYLLGYAVEGWRSRK